MWAVTLWGGPLVVIHRDEVNVLPNLGSKECRVEECEPQSSRYGPEVPCEPLDLENCASLSKAE